MTPVVFVVEAAGLFKDCLGKAVPAKGIWLSEVIDTPVVFGFWQYFRHYEPNNFSGGGGLAYLVVDHVDLFAHRADMQHGFNKVVAVFRKNPAGAKDQMFAVYLGDGFLSGQFTGAIDSQWCCGIIFSPGSFFTAIKYIVGGEMYQGYIQPIADFGEVGWAAFINQVGVVFFRLGEVDLGIGAGVDNKVGALAGDHGLYFVDTGDIQIAATVG